MGGCDARRNLRVVGRLMRINASPVHESYTGYGCNFWKAGSMRHNRINGEFLKRACLLAGILFAGIAVFGPSLHAAGSGKLSKGATKAPASREGRGLVVAIPIIDAARGRRLFVNKGCVICHSINGVGGKAGPPLDARDRNSVIDIFDFAARMWAGSFAMIELQGMELGYQLEINGDELGHIAAFVYDRQAQRRFTRADVPDLIKDMIIREPYEPGKGLDDPRQ